MSLLLLAHLIFMSTACILVIIGVIIAKKRAKNWLRFHRMYVTLGVVSSVLGAMSIVFLKFSHHFSHFQSPHAIAGLITLCLLQLTPILGASIAKGPKPIRAFHRFFGRITSIAIILTVIMGVFRLLLLNKE
jgi:hypothetical protein